jgi:1-acyl-sn-glycerol-3-phosphate acyltransferase
LASLWLSQVGRVMADHCLRFFVVLKMANAGAGERESAWHLVVTIFALPSIALTPLIGAIGNSLPKRWVLVASAAFCLVVIAGFAPAQGGWYWCLSLVAVGSALYGPVRYAILPAAARDTHLPLPRVIGWIEMGAVSAIVGGMALAGYWNGTSVSPHGEIKSEAAFSVVGDGTSFPLSVLAAIGLSGIGLVFALPTCFASDARRADAPGKALAGFFQDSVRILKDREARGSLLAWAGFRGLVAAVTGALVAEILDQAPSGEKGEAFHSLVRVVVWVMGGAALGSFLAGVQGHPRRSLGLVPIGLTGLLIALVWTAIFPSQGWALCLVVGAFGGLVNAPLLSTYQAAVPADARGNGMAVMNTANYVAMTVMCLVVGVLARLQILNASGQVWLVAGVTGFGVVLAWRVLFRDSVEQFLEIVLWPVYRIHGYGPGKETCPRRGPLLMVANHSSWFDPLWLAKVLPCRLTPMMTSLFYDLPVLRWVMVHWVHAIRVESSTYRREAPELQEAIAALDRGECIAIFPEGMLRRRDDLYLRRFGQGIWHILRERPNTPVVTCWIEGGWGSYMSYKGGPPLANKRMDWWRKIDIGINDPQILEPETLADHWKTRVHLMRACLDARRHLGLAPVPQKDLDRGAACDSAEERPQELGRAFENSD